MGKSMGKSITPVPIDFPIDFFYFDFLESKLSCYCYFTRKTLKLNKKKSKMVLITTDMFAVGGQECIKTIFLIYMEH